MCDVYGWQGKFYIYIIMYVCKCSYPRKLEVLDPLELKLQDVWNWTGVCIMYV